MTPLLAAEEVSLHVGRRVLVDRVSLALRPGRVTVVVGPNGAGKSSLLRLLSGERSPSGGRVTCEGRDLARLRPDQLACLRAVLPQASRLAFPFTAREVVRIGVDGIGRGLDTRARTAIVDGALAAADVGHLADRLYQSLSGGEGQRVQFARVLAQLRAGRSLADRQALLLDEPVSSLDLRHQVALMGSAAALARDGTVVLAILHDLNLASAYADEIVVLHEGRVVRAGPAAETLTDDVMTGVFGIDLAVGAVPQDGRPFVLPFRTGVTPAQRFAPNS